MKRFSTDLRIRSQQEFQSVFSRRKRIFSDLFVLYYLPNSLEHPRVGVVASKKNVRFAVSRNQIKRIVRERIRLNQNTLQGFDLVFVAHKAASSASKEELHACLESLVEQLIAQSGKSCTS